MFNFHQINFNHLKSSLFNHLLQHTNHQIVNGVILNHVKNILQKHYQLEKNQRLKIQRIKNTK